MKLKCLLIVVVMFFCITTVKAEVYYNNENGVSFTKEEYDFITNMFYPGYQNIMNFEDYENIFENDTVNNEIRKKTFEPYVSEAARGFFHASASKRITIATSCSSTCLVTVNAIWTATPNVRSYDVIGAYLDDVDLYNTPTTTVANSTGSSRSDEIVEKSNGFGVSIKLLSSGNEMQVSQYFRVTTGGTIYASYQHAKRTITLANSKKYDISRSGYGGVFLFNSGITSYYDAMGGVDISV